MFFEFILSFIKESHPKNSCIIQSTLNRGPLEKYLSISIEKN